MQAPEPPPRRRDAAVLLGLLLVAGTLWVTVLGPLGGDAGWRTLLGVAALLALSRLFDGPLRRFRRRVRGRADAMETAGPSRLVRRLRGEGIRDPRVLRAIARVPRDRFCEPEDRSRAWEDRVLSLPEAGATLSQPYVVALMLQALGLEGGERVLDVGSGSGYTSALLAHLAREVHGLERSPMLVERSRRLLQELGLADRVRIHAGDGWRGLPGEAPWDAILVSAAVPEPPPALAAQLAPGGRLVLPLDDGTGLAQDLVLLRKGENGRLEEPTRLGGVRFVPLVPEAAGRRRPETEP